MPPLSIIQKTPITSNKPQSSNLEAFIHQNLNSKGFSLGKPHNESHYVFNHDINNSNQSRSKNQYFSPPKKVYKPELGYYNQYNKPIINNSISTSHMHMNESHYSQYEEDINPRKRDELSFELSNKLLLGNNQGCHTTRNSNNNKINFQYGVSGNNSGVHDESLRNYVSNNGGHSIRIKSILAGEANINRSQGSSKIYI